MYPRLNTPSPALEPRYVPVSAGEEKERLVWLEEGEGGGGAGGNRAMLGEGEKFVPLWLEGLFDHPARAYLPKTKANAHDRFKLGRLSRSREREGRCGFGVVRLLPLSVAFEREETLDVGLDGCEFPEA